MFIILPGYCLRSATFLHGIQVFAAELHGSFPLLCDARRLIALVSVRVVKHALPACCLRRLGVHGAALPAPRVSFLPWDS